MATFFAKNPSFSLKKLPVQPFFLSGFSRKGVLLSAQYPGIMIQHPWFKQAVIHPFWMGVSSLLISSFGVIFLHWTLEPVVWLLWFEIIFAVGSALVRSLFALQGGGFFQNLLSRLFVTGAGAVMGIAFIMLTVTFTIHGIDTENGSGPGANFFPQLVLLFANYVVALLLHFFLNGRYKTASPLGELMVTFLHFLLLLCLIMPITMHLLPKYPEFGHARWVGLTVLVAKFLVDSAFSRVSRQVARLPLNDDDSSQVA
jgi:hypothetical protein